MKQTVVDNDYNQNMKFEAPEVDEFTKLIDKYNKKLNTINLEDHEGKHKIFANWKTVSNNIYINPNEANEKAFSVNDIDKLRLLNIEEISKYDDNGNIMLYYIITEIDKLFHFNQNKAQQNNVTMFVIEFIKYMFNMFNTDEIISTYDIKRFMYILESHGYVHDIEEKGHGIDMPETEGIYEEYKSDDTLTDEEKEKQAEEKTDDKEEAEALDIDVDVDADETAEDYYPQMFDDDYVEYKD